MHIADPDIARRLATIKSNADEINDLSEDVNERLEEFEDALRTAGVGLSADVPLDLGGERYRVGFGKAESTWCLVVTRGGANSATTPLLKAPRKTRVHALALMPALLDAIIAAQKVMLTKLLHSEGE
jgi:hypothetical protein